MPRASIGAAARTKTGSVRVTQSQYDYFTTKFGGLGKFLQAKVNEELNAHGPDARCRDGQHTTPHKGCILR